MNTSYYNNYLPSALLLSCLFFLFPSHTLALTADEVVVIANTKANDSLSLAKYYMQQRAIPAENLITIRTTWKESCGREQYQEDIAEPVKEAVQKLQRQKRIRCLVTMYGVPLKIRPPILDFDNEEQVKQLKQQLSQHQKKIKAAQNNDHSQLKDLIDSLKLQIKLLQQTDTRAAVDSELALVLTNTYPLENWLPNPYFLGFQRQKNLLQRDNVLMVSRLDGPAPDTVRRIIDDSIAVEQKGLRGKAYFDARWPQPDEKKKLSGYALYDAAIHKAAEVVTRDKRMEVLLNEQNALFTTGDCPETALYCGWYSLSKYVDAFTWVPGAVGFHIASGECSTLKRENSQVWCKRMIEEGVAATVGPVYEPYVQAFPLPDIFFNKLTEGYLTLGEVYLISLPFLSWQMVLIGDPLYQPFSPVIADNSPTTSLRAEKNSTL